MWTDSWAAFDTETSGVGTAARILEVGVVTFEGGQPVREWSQLICPPDVDWNDPKVQEALAVNKLTADLLHGRPTFEQILPDLLVELSHDVLVAHNADFDMRMIAQELQRLSRPALSPRLLICTLNLASHQRGQVKGNKLGDVAARYNVPQNGAHRAVVDAATCGLVLTAMLRAGHVPGEDAAMSELTKTASARRRW